MYVPHPFDSHLLICVTRFLYTFQHHPYLNSIEIHGNYLEVNFKPSTSPTEDSFYKHNQQLSKIARGCYFIPYRVDANELQRLFDHSPNKTEIYAMIEAYKEMYNQPRTMDQKFIGLYHSQIRIAEAILNAGRKTRIPPETKQEFLKQFGVLKDIFISTNNELSELHIAQIKNSLNHFEDLEDLSLNCFAGFSNFYQFDMFNMLTKFKCDLEKMEEIVEFKRSLAQNSFQRFINHPLTILTIFGITCGLLGLIAAILSCCATLYVGNRILNSRNAKQYSAYDPYLDSYYQTPSSYNSLVLGKRAAVSTFYFLSAQLQSVTWKHPCEYYGGMASEKMAQVKKKLFRQ